MAGRKAMAFEVDTGFFGAPDVLNSRLQKTGSAKEAKLKTSVPNKAPGSSRVQRQESTGVNKSKPQLTVSSRSVPKTTEDSDKKLSHAKNPIIRSNSSSTARSKSRGSVNGQKPAQNSTEQSTSKQTRSKPKPTQPQNKLPENKSTRKLLSQPDQDKTRDAQAIAKDAPRTSVPTTHTQMPIATKTERGPVRVNPITGEMIRIDPSEQKKGVRDGSMIIPEKYLHAAADAGLGNSEGMYGHMKNLQRRVNDQFHTDYHPEDAPEDTKTKAEGSGTSHVTGKKMGSTTIHSFSSAPDRPTKIKQVVQGKTRTTTLTKASSTKENVSYQSFKGVVNTFSGPVSVCKKGNEGKNSSEITRKSEASKNEAPRRVSITKKLGGKTNSDLSDAEKRLQYFENKFNT